MRRFVLIPLVALPLAACTATTGPAPTAPTAPATVAATEAATPNVDVTAEPVSTVSATDERVLIGFNRVGLEELAGVPMSEMATALSDPNTWRRHPLLTADADGIAAAVVAHPDTVATVLTGVGADDYSQFTVLLLRADGTTRVVVGSGGGLH